ncbi:DUF2783 domain-containing protein [Photorhabdus cinerea]|uniref:DUF2783 domain-containing protein n=1 Tax=Photorhabdus cinerea TaxID=471575 RepID=A0A7X5TGA8_9GAMM|nr:DUF2783 domain-containing protein [Photorhabdus cinerea]NHB91203.1 hypothetical protein [Photorhabdus cinerea]
MKPYNHFLAGSLITYSHLTDPDACYEMITEACQELGDELGNLFYAQLVLLLVNHIGDSNILREAITVTRKGLTTVAN